jgi:hypothetical protein
VALERFRLADTLERRSQAVPDQLVDPFERALDDLGIFRLPRDTVSPGRRVEDSASRLDELVLLAFAGVELGNTLHQVLRVGGRGRQMQRLLDRGPFTPPSASVGPVFDPWRACKEAGKKAAF